MGDKDIIKPKLLMSKEQYQNTFVREELREHQPPLPKMKYIAVGPRCSFAITCIYIFIFNFYYLYIDDNIVYRWGRILGGTSDIEFPYLYFSSI